MLPSFVCGLALVLLATACGGQRPVTPPSEAFVSSAEPTAAPVSAPHPACALLLATNPRHRHDAFETLVRTANSDRDVACALEGLEALYPALVAERPPPVDRHALRRWWDIVGSRAIAQRWDADHFVVLPDDPGSIAASRHGPRFAPLLCREPGCGLDARGFLAHAERTMADLARMERSGRYVEAVERNEPAPASWEEAVAACDEAARTGHGPARLAYWQSCVTHVVPHVTRIPWDDFVMPNRGTLVTDFYGYFEPCRRTRGYALGSGLVVERARCYLLETKTRVERFTVERIADGAPERAVLFALLMPHMIETPAFAASFRIPDGVEPDGHGAGYGFGRGFGSSDVPEMRYEITGVFLDSSRGHLYAFHEGEPRKRFLAGLLVDLQDAGHPTCVDASSRDEVRRVLLALLPADDDPDTILSSLRCAPGSPTLGGRPRLGPSSSSSRSTGGGYSLSVMGM